MEGQQAWEPAIEIAVVQLKEAGWAVVVLLVTVPPAS